MIMVTQNGKHTYLVNIEHPELEWVMDLAKCMGITREAIIAAAINKGLCHYVETFCKEDVVDKIQGLAADEIDKMNDVGEEPDTNYSGDSPDKDSEH